MCQYLIKDHEGDADCFLQAPFDCEYCKFGIGKLNPLAKKYQRTNGNIQQQDQADSAGKPHSLS